MCPKVKLPLGSMSAKKSISRLLTFYDRGGRQKVKKYGAPALIKEVTLKQWTRRHITGLLTAHWQCMTTDQKAVYEDTVKSKRLKMSGYNYFFKLAQADLYAHHGLCAYWSMNEATGAQVTDYSGNANHGTLNPTYPSDCPIRVDSMIKQYGNSLLFNTLDHRVIIPHDESFNFDTTDNFTISGWFKLKPTVVWPPPLNRGAGSPSSKGYRFEYTSGHRIYFLICDGSTRDELVSTSNVDDFVWHFLAGVSDGSAKKLYFYFDGEEDAVGDIEIVGSMKVTRALTIGFYGVGNIIDEVRIYNRALGADEIFKQYNLLRLDKQRQSLPLY